MDIVIDLYLYLLRIHGGYLLKDLYKGIVLSDSYQSFFIHIGRLYSEVCGR